MANDLKTIYDAIQQVEIIGISGLKPEVLDEIAHYPYVDTREHLPSIDEKENKNDSENEDDTENNSSDNPEVIGE